MDMAEKTKEELMKDNVQLKRQLELKRKKQEEQKNNKTVYYIARFGEVICIGIFVFGLLWNTTEMINLTTPQFMMLYGGSGALISEVLSRVFKKKITE